MALYEIGFRSAAPAATIGKPYLVLWNLATERLRVREIGVWLSAATESNLALVRASARGTQTATTPVGQSEDPGDTAGVAVVDTAWSADPTVSTNYHRRAHLAAAIGAGLIWTWWASPSGLIVANAAGVAVVTPAAVAGGALDGYVVYEEK